MAKYVVSSTLHNPDWANCSVLTGDVPARSPTSSGAFDGDLVYASFQLARTLIEHGLVNELRLSLSPCVLGTKTTTSHCG